MSASARWLGAMRSEVKGGGGGQRLPPEDMSAALHPASAFLRSARSRLLRRSPAALGLPLDRLTKRYLLGSELLQQRQRFERGGSLAGCNAERSKGGGGGQRLPPEDMSAALHPASAFLQSASELLQQRQRLEQALLRSIAPSQRVPVVGLRVAAAAPALGAGSLAQHCAQPARSCGRPQSCCRSASALSRVSSRLAKQKRTTLLEQPAS